MRAEAESVVHRARLAPGLAGRQVRASGGAEHHSGSPFSASNFLCQFVESLAELAGKSRRLGYWCKTRQKSGTVQLLITETRSR